MLAKGRSRLLTLRYIRAVHEAVKAAHRQSGHPRDRVDT
ncbi:hypothetical protein STXM2123_1765 [Streptomyces sp. F-3]|nr:hypothetical protein STXM2123_1765 [Streptomyces sp. F-3]